MADNLPTEFYRAGETVFREGETGDRAYLIQSGRVRIESSAGGRTIVFAEFGANEIIGEMALMDDSSRSATIVASSDTVLVPVTRSLITERLKDTDPITRLLLHGLLTRLRRTNRRLSGIDDIPPAIFPEMTTPVLEEIELNNTLERMIADGTIELHFQPIVHAQNLETAGFEALLRTGAALPDSLSIQHLIEHAERTGLVLPLGLRVLQIGQDALARFRALHNGPLFVSVNMSARQLEQPEHVRLLTEAITARAQPGLKLELTETALLNSPEACAQALEQLKEAGASIALDDFGTGFSSLGYLDRLPLDTLKIDRTFVRLLDENRNSQRIVRAIVGLAQELELDTVAEGVETELQLRVLRDIGCDFIQGFLISRPLCLDDAIDWLGR
jgi:diguanylate cyclase